MMGKKDLFEMVAHKNCCYYISDLKNPRNREIILDTLSRMDLSEYSLKALSDMANYITDMDCDFKTETEARCFFVAMKSAG